MNVILQDFVKLTIHSQKLSKLVFFSKQRFHKIYSFISYLRFVAIFPDALINNSSRY